ncbi:MAG: tRNA (adenosine(37)-N6)-threonylcarbamoyltransferase complex ATPase subunit type 1 TsaE [Caulobacterales bacterium]
MTLADSSEAAAALRTFPLLDAAATLALGKALGKAVRRGDVIFLYGELGAGKTTLARGVIETATGETDIPSPTYNLVQIYAGPDFDIWHMDLYRLKSPEEAFELGLEDAAGAVQLVEWPERLQDNGPAPNLSVRLSPDGEGGRLAVLSAGPEWEKRLVAI